MSDTTTYTCPWCRTETAGTALSCPTCGAPVDVRMRTTASGWTEIPPIADMARIQLGQSSAQIAGRFVPAAEVTLAAGDSLYFPHPSLLWAEPAVGITDMSLKRAWTRHRAGLPLVMLEARGPGRLAFSHDTAGELLAVPLQPGAAVDVRENMMVVATGGVAYDWVDSNIWFQTSGGAQQDEAGGAKILRMGLDLAGAGGGRERDRRQDETEWHFPVGQYVDRFTAGERPGAVLVQVGGNALLRDLGEGETILVKPPSLLFKDPGVGMQLHVEFPHAGMKLWRTWGNRYLWLRLTGPGRVALQSCYERLEDPGTDFRESCAYSQHVW